MRCHRKDSATRGISGIVRQLVRIVALTCVNFRGLPGRTIGGIVLPPVVMEVINPNYWPDFPWTGIAPYFDVWLPMSYWTNRTQASGYRDGYSYTAENIVRLANGTEPRFNRK